MTDEIVSVSISNAPPVQVTGPHANQSVLFGGAPLDLATYALVLVHGRGGSAEGMIPIARAAGALDAALIAPRAAGGSWYPERFLAPISSNEPYLSSALSAIGHAVSMARGAGIPSKRILLVGFSQGACLSLEYAARNAQRLGGIAALAGALIGDANDARQDRGDFDGTPILLACGTADAHIPETRVREAAELLEAQGATVDLRLYPDVGHDIVGDEIDALREMVEATRPAA